MNSLFSFIVHYLRQGINNLVTQNRSRVKLSSQVFGLYKCPLKAHVLKA
jgi:hypothetical protein